MRRSTSLSQPWFIRQMPHHTDEGKFEGVGAFREQQ